ncbi:MAG: two component, sigma54 specific, transcriptional regulator, Fis family [Pedosphaera sp.]|nr:two component, sigma54 specific, transcriptional regulator, Fis family [Pedosphaera sp.]
MLEAGNIPARIYQEVDVPVKIKVLLVDDDFSVRESLQRVLQSENYDVVSASNGREAVERFCEQSIDLVLLDLNMPVLNGWEALERMKAINPFLLTIIITARPNQYELAAQAGAVAIMEKPLTLPLLLDLMSRVMKEPLEVRKQRITAHKPIRLCEVETTNYLN